MAQEKTFDDIDLMQFVDGELDVSDADALEAHLASLDEATGDQAALKVQALDQMGDTLRSFLELEADAAEPRLDAMWEAIDSEIQKSDAVVEKRPRVKAKREPREGLWAQIVRFFEGYRGHILTGAVAAGAAAAIILALRPPQEVIVERPVAVHPMPDRGQPGQISVGATEPAKPSMTLVADDPTPPEIETLDVEDGSGAVFVLPSEGEGDVSATVIFVDFDDAEGPIL